MAKPNRLCAYVEAIVPTLTLTVCHTEWPFGRGHQRRPKLTHQARAMHTVRYAWFVLYGDWPVNQLNHTCHNVECWNPYHVYDGTQAQNVADLKKRPQRGPLPGERNWNARLTAADVRAIRQRYAAGGVTQAQLAAEYGVGRWAVRDVVVGKTWTHV